MGTIMAIDPTPIPVMKRPARILENSKSAVSGPCPGKQYGRQDSLEELLTCCDLPR